MGKKEKTKKHKKMSFADLMIPIVSGLIFVLVLFFILLPSINNSSEMLLEIEKTKKEQEILRKNLNVVEGVNFAVLQKDLSNARKVLPKRLEVAQFAYYVDELAKEKGLVFRELKAGDMSVSTEENSILDVKGVRVPMVYAGDHQPIVDFFNELQLVSPYVISFGHKVELNKTESDAGQETWNLEIDITGYYVEEDENIVRTVNFLVPFSSYDSQENMVKEFSERVEKLIN